MIVELYTKDQCGYCSAAKALLSSRSVQYVENVLGVHFTRETLKSKYPQATTYPVIVVDGYYIGGYNQLKEHFERSESGTQQLLTE